MMKCPGRTAHATIRGLDRSQRKVVGPNCFSSDEKHYTPLIGDCSRIRGKESRGVKRAGVTQLWNRDPTGQRHKGPANRCIRL